MKEAAPVALNDGIYKVKYKGKLIEVDLMADLSNQRLREMKARFGQQYGTPAGLISLLTTGDMDAIGCMIWIGQQKPRWKGEVEDLLAMDFSLADLENVEDPPPVEAAKGKGSRPTKAGSTSEPTSETSETGTSSTSATSSD